MSFKAPETPIQGERSETNIDLYTWFVGHSLWFKNFFNTYLPLDGPEGPVDAKDCKMKNGGCVAFTLEVIGTTASGILAWFFFAREHFSTHFPRLLPHF